MKSLLIWLVPIRSSSAERCASAPTQNLVTQPGDSTFPDKPPLRTSDSPFYSARTRLPIDSELILTLTAYLREVLQAKVNAEAVAYEALKKAGLKSHYYTAEISREP